LSLAHLANSVPTAARLLASNFIQSILDNDPARLVQAFGRQPLSVAMRCYHARAHNRSKDHCQLVCGLDSNGLTADTIDGAEILTINGIQFLNETWSEGAMSHMGDFTAYSTAKGTACISLTFLLFSVVPEVMETPPPRFDPAVETAVFTTIMLTYADQ
jgi:hypothetical protein